MGEIGGNGGSFGCGIGEGDDFVGNLGWGSVRLGFVWLSGEL